MPPFFPNEELDIYTLQADNNDYDYYGAKNEYAYKETIQVDIQPLSPTSSLKQFGKILQDTYTVIFDVNTEISDTDQLRIHNEKFEIIGSVETWNHGILPHKEMLIQKQRKKVG